MCMSNVRVFVIPHNTVPHHTATVSTDSTSSSSCTRLRDQAYQVRNPSERRRPPTSASRTPSQRPVRASGCVRVLRAHAACAPTPAADTRRHTQTRRHTGPSDACHGDSTQVALAWKVDPTAAYGMTTTPCRGGGM
eukprot:TRINITY_DN74349_c0_g1_i1.p2 TRINITY_DN74349_c0_g1~~TRINITY_DN74349_c0_g1_i1.p2  ORF type:complete len:136 (-),score=4.63 TRINITY_DN74349_c0_g1_i1:106-513(-)